MKRNILFTLLLAVIIGLSFVACEDTSGGPEDLYTGIPNSSWSDVLVPETTLLFLTNQVTLGGTSTGTPAQNWYWGDLGGRSYPFDVVDDQASILEIVDRVEDNWGTNDPALPDSIVLVWTDQAKKIGIQIYYYAAGRGKNYERLVCWGVGQPHEFRRR
jgi:hypothetical protein